MMTNQPLVQFFWTRTPPERDSQLLSQALIAAQIPRTFIVESGAAGLNRYL